MAEDATASGRRRHFIGTLTVLLLVVIAVAAGVVIWYTVLDDSLVPEIITIGDDGNDATETSVETPVTTGEEQAGQRRSSDDPRDILVPQRGVLVVPQEIKLIDIIPSPRIVTLDGPGQSQQLTVQGFYSDGSTGDLVLKPGEEFFFASSDTSVVEVAPNGVLSSHKAGGADVLVAYRHLEAEVPVLVWGEVRRIPPVDPDRLLPIDDDGTAIVLNRVMVELVPGYGLAAAEELAASIGGKVIFEYRTFRGFVIDFGARTEEELRTTINWLLTKPRVDAAYSDITMTLGQSRPTSTPTRTPCPYPVDQGLLGGPVPVLSPAVHIESLDNRKEADAYLRVGMEEAWVRMNNLPDTVFDTPVLIAVIDSDFPSPPIEKFADGIMTREFDHGNVQSFMYEPSFSAGKIHIRDLVANEGNVEHGVAVASVLVAENNNPTLDGGFSGVVSSVDNLEYKLIFYGVGLDNKDFDSEQLTTALNLINALEHIEPYGSQVDVVNLSYGVNCKQRLAKDCHNTKARITEATDDAETDHAWRLLELFRKMEEVTFVVSAGNENLDIERNLVVPAIFSDEPNVIAVAGSETCNSHGRPTLHPESNEGSKVTLSAPYEVLTVEILGGYLVLPGTSFSAPLVSGTVALLKALNPGLTPLDIKTRLINTGIHMVERVIPWKQLNAGYAIREEYNSLSISSNIDQTKVTHELVPGDNLGTPPKLVVKVVAINTGRRNWQFALSGTATLPSGAIARSNLPRQFIAAGDSVKFNLEFTVGEPGTWTITVGLYRVDDFSQSQATHVFQVEGVVPQSEPTAQVALAPPTPGAAASGACLPPSAAPEAYPQTHGRIIEVETFQKPSAVSSAMLMFKINNPSSSSGPFFIKEEILSHPDQFGWFNENPMREIGIRPGGTAHLLITPNPNGYTHPESGKREFDLDWETFNFGCELEIRLSVFADEAGSVLLDYVTLWERMEPFQREPWEQTSEPGFVVTPVPFPVTNAEVSAKARELKRRLEPITDLITSRTEGFSGGCTGVISEWEEMYIGIQELYLYPTSQLKMGVLERIEMMLNEFIPKWERAGCL